MRSRACSLRLYAYGCHRIVGDGPDPNNLSDWQKAQLVAMKYTREADDKSIAHFTSLFRNCDEASMKVPK